VRARSAAMSGRSVMVGGAVLQPLQASWLRALGRCCKGSEFVRLWDSFLLAGAHTCGPLPVWWIFWGCEERKRGWDDVVKRSGVKCARQVTVAR
jgi:hypothetical protein